MLATCPSVSVPDTLLVRDIVGVAFVTLIDCSNSVTPPPPVELAVNTYRSGVRESRNVSDTLVPFLYRSWVSVPAEALTVCTPP